MLADSNIQKIYAKSLHMKKFLAKKRRFVVSPIIFGRIKVVNFIALLIISVIICRLIYLNTFNNGFLTKQINSRVLRTVKVTAMRGTIYDRNNNPLSVSTPVASIWADPNELAHLSNSQLIKAAKILDMPVSLLNEKLNQKNKSFVYIKRAVSPSEALQIKQLNIEGIYSIQEFKRYYPNGGVSAHVVGFTNIDDKGAEGIEYANNQTLGGSNGQIQIIRDRQGHVVEQLKDKKTVVNGQDIHLSIDDRLQYIVYQALKEGVAKVGAKGGAAIILDAKTGEVLSMVNMPTYNPNNREGVSLDALRNRVAIDIYEPGSIIKPLVVAKALNDKIVTPDTVFNTMPYSVGPKLIKDTHDHPRLTVSQIIEKSSDVGASKIGMKYRPKELWSYYNSIGFGERVGTGFPAEARGILRPWQKWYPIDQATMSFGYGVSVSLLQMARAYSMFTNNGCILPVTFYKIADTHNIPCKQIVSPYVSKEVQIMLDQVTEDGGTGKLARVEGYTTAGKTGTAHKLGQHGYAEHNYYGSFVGYAPSRNPRVIVAVMIDDPKIGGYYGGKVAAPIFSSIVGASLPILGVKPDR